MKGFLKRVSITAAVFTLGVAAAATGSQAPAGDADFGKRVAHEIRMYSRYTIWTTSTCAWRGAMCSCSDR